MQKKSRCLVGILLTLCLVSGAAMESEKQISLQSGVRTGLGNGVFVTFSSYGHEHSSSGPDELFIATHAVYELTLERGEETEVLYLTLDVSGNSSPDTVESGDYSFTALSESTQDVLVLRWIASRACR